MTKVGQGCGVEVLERAKRLAEACWVVEHAKVCSLCEGAKASTRNGKQLRCPVAGCAEAKRCVLAVEQGREVDASDPAVTQAKAVLDHRSSCCWAHGAAGKKSEAQKSSPPRDEAGDGEEVCLVCILVDRARPVVTEMGALRLDFSKQQEGPLFEAPACGPHQASPCTTSDKMTPKRLNLQRCSTQELALMLSDLSRTQGSTASSSSSSARRSRADVEDGDSATRHVAFMGAVVGQDAATPRDEPRGALDSVLELRCDEDEDEPHSSRITVDDENEAASLEDESPVRSLRSGSKRRLDEGNESGPCADRDETRAAKQRKALVAKALIAAASGPSPRVLSPRANNSNSNVTMVPHSPSFSAAASSLLALTASKPPRAAQRLVPLY